MLINTHSAARLTAPAMTATCSAPNAAARPVLATTGVPGGAVLGRIPMPGMATTARTEQAQFMPVQLTQAQFKQKTWQYPTFEFPKTAHHNSMDLGSDIRDAGSVVRTDAGRPPRGVPR